MTGGRRRRAHLVFLLAASCGGGPTSVGAGPAAPALVAPEPVPAEDPGPPEPPGSIDDPAEPAPGPAVVAQADDAPGGGPERPAPSPDKFEPAAGRVKLSAFLEAPAEQALKARQFGRAVALYRGLVAARGPGDPAALKLAQAWTLAGQYEEAQEVLTAFTLATEDDEARGAADRERRRLAGATAPFTGAFKVDPASKEARDAFKRGRAAFKKKQLAEALLYYRMGYALDPDLPGFLRELGETYKRLGAAAEKNEFFLQYLRVRPLGRNADDIRKELKRDSNLLGSLDIASPLPCEEIWLAGQQVTVKLPVRNLMVAPGTYKGLCVNYKYQIGYFEYAKVEAGKSASMDFRWAIVVNQLQNPYGRIVLEDARKPNVMMDLGIETPEVGVIVPRDGRSLKMVLKADDGSRREERYLKLEAGQREVIKW